MSSRKFDGWGMRVDADIPRTLYDLREFDGTVLPGPFRVLTWVNHDHDCIGVAADDTQGWPVAYFDLGKHFLEDDEDPRAYMPTLYAEGRVGRDGAWRPTGRVVCVANHQIVLSRAERGGRKI